MNRKELKKIALEVAKNERRLNKSTKEAEKDKYEKEIVKYTRGLSIEDLIAIDEIIQKKYKYILDK